MVFPEGYVQRISNHYNKRQAGGFGRKNSVKKFLHPTGLSIGAKPPPFYGDNKELLTRQEEFQIFSAMHFVKFRIKKYSTKGRLQPLLRLYLALRNRAISANWRLVPACVKRYRGPYADFDHLCTLGHHSLVSAVDAFDPWRGFRLSTYACNAIIRQFYRRKKQLPINAHIDVYSVSSQEVNDRGDSEEALWVERVKKVVREAITTGRLEKREQCILSWRFGFHDSPMTLKEVAKILGITNEWVRQIQNKALSKLKEDLQKDPVLNIQARKDTLINVL